MKAMVLAAGRGVRMRPLTLSRAKPALPVLNRPLIEWTLKRLAAAGVHEVAINLHHLPSTVRDVVGHGEALGLKIVYSHEPRILGTGGGPRKVRAFLGDEPFLLVNGDVLFDFDIDAFVEAARGSGARACLALVPNPDPRRYTPVFTRPGGRIRAFGGRAPAGAWRAKLFSGVSVLDPRLLERLPNGRSDIVRNLYAPLIEEGKGVVGIEVHGRWYDFGSPALYLASHVSMLSSGSWRATGRLVDPDADVHPRAKVTQSVVGSGSRVEAGAQIARSILWDRVHVGEGALVRGSILASGVWVKPREALEGLVVMLTAGGTRRRFAEVG